MAQISSVSYTASTTPITRNYFLYRISDYIQQICPCLGLCGVNTLRRDSSRISVFSKQDRKDAERKSFFKASFIPLFLCRFIYNNEIKTVPTTVNMPVIMMICNIPSFIELTEIYNKSELFAYDTLSSEINEQFSPIIDFITSQGGDFIQFTNCMMYFIWQTSGNINLSMSVCNVVDIATYIIECYHHHLRKCGVSIKNIIGISMGNLSIHIVGDSTEILYCPFGDTVQECLTAVELSSPGEIVVTSTVWQHVGSNKHYYIPTELENGFIQLRRSGIIPPFHDHPLVIVGILELLNEVQIGYLDELNTCLHPLAKSATTVQQLEILSSMTQICVGTAYIKELDMRSAEMLQKALLLLSKIIKKYEGILPQILYDEGVIFTFYFGYPGFKHPDDAYRCLMFCREATSVFETLGLSIIFRLSLGMCFSGTIGTNHRHETAVFGKSVTNVLHLAHHFVDVKIMCCVNIVLSTRREIGDIFTFINRRARGFKNMPTSYSVDFRSRRTELKVKCIGRESEKEAVLCALKEIKNLDMQTSLKLPLISIIGAIGTGRTNFLQWMVQESEHIGYCVRCFIGQSTFDDNFEQACQIVREILRLTNSNTQAKIERLLGIQANLYPLFILNRFLHTEFSDNGFFEKNKEELINSMLVNLVKACTRNKTLIIGLDDGEHIGRKSWLFLHDLIVTHTACVVVSFIDPVKPDMPLIINLLKQQYLSITLGPLSSNDLVSLACHFLNVIAIHKYFVSFLVHHSKGNPLRLQEILMLPQLQSHICLSFYKSIVRSTLAEMFHSIEGVPAETKNRKMNVCDILDPEGLPSVYVPQHLLEVVKERTSGLLPEEQMLIKKCACLGDSFSLFLLYVVCPEYSEMNLRSCVKKLLGLNILLCTCNHLLSEIDSRRNTYMEYSNEFCPHPIQFSSKFLRNCITDFIPQGQKDRLHLFIVSLIKDADINCEPCRRLAGFQLFPSNDIFISDVTVPKYNILFCHCLDYKLALFTNIDYHLTRGNAPVSQRIKFFLKASETAVIAERDPMIQRFLTMAEYLLLKADNMIDKSFFPDLAKAGVKRLQAQSHMNAGNDSDAVEHLGRALMLLGKIFPDSYLKRRKRKGIVQDIDFVVEESKCLIIGCSLLINFSKFYDAYYIGKLNLSIQRVCEIQTEGLYPDFVNALNVKMLLLLSGVKASKHKAKRRLTRWMAELIYLCNTKLNQNPHVGVQGMKGVINAYTCLTQILFEHNMLSSALGVGFRAFQLTKVLNGQTEFLFLGPILCLVLFHQRNLTKCLEVAIEVNDSANQNKDILTIALSYCVITKVLKTMENLKMHIEKLKVTEEFCTKNIDVLLNTKNRSIVYWISCNLSLWTYEQEMDESNDEWSTRSSLMRDSINKDDYWAISASLVLVKIKFHEMKTRIHAYDVSQLEVLIDKIEKELRSIEGDTQCFAPVLFDSIKRIRFRMQDEVSANIG